MNDKKLYNLYGCSRKLRIPAKWLKEKTKSGDIPCLRIGKRGYFYNIEAVKAALAKLAAKGGGDD